MEIKDLITYTKEYPAREAIYSDFPKICFRSFPHI